MKHYFIVCLASLLIVNTTLAEENDVTGIIGALDMEVALLEKLAENAAEMNIMGLRFVTGTLSGRNIVLVRSGVGKVNAAMTATLLIEHFDPDEVIFTGVAGGINPELKPGDIVIAEKTAQHDFGDYILDGIQNKGARNPVDLTRNPVFFPADSVLLRLAEMSAEDVLFERIDTGTTVRTPCVVTGTVVTGDIFIASKSKKKELRERLNADAVEMEGGAVAQICWQFDIPCLVIRSLSDSADENAESDFDVFVNTAAGNSARLVAEIVSRLTSK